MGYTSQVATLTAINAIAVLGFYVTMSSGELSIAHGAFYAIGAYACGYVLMHSSVPFVVAILAAVGAGAVVSVFIFPAVRMKGLYFAVATFAFGNAVAAAVIHINAIGGPFGMVGIPLDTTLTISLIILAIGLIITQALDHSPLHAALTATRDDPEVAAALGLRVARLRRVTLVVGAGLAGASGALYASSVGVVTATDASFNQSLSFLLMAVVGGTRSSWGALLGAIVWTVAPEVLRFANNANVIQILFGCLAILVMAFRPQGLLDRGDFKRLYLLARALPWDARTRDAESREAERTNLPPDGARPPAITSASDREVG